MCEIKAPEFKRKGPFFDIGKYSRNFQIYRLSQPRPVVNKFKPPRYHFAYLAFSMRCFPRCVERGGVDQALTVFGNQTYWSAIPHPLCLQPTHYSRCLVLKVGLERH